MNRRERERKEAEKIESVITVVHILPKHLKYAINSMIYDLKILCSVEKDEQKGEKTKRPVVVVWQPC